MTAELLPSRRRLLVALWAVGAAGALVLALGRGLLPPVPGPPVAVAVQLDLNRATVPELMALPGIGRSRAEAIVLHRVRHGPFRSVAGLASVDGIGPVIAASIAPMVRVAGDGG